jgi:glycine/D-amino acid oxidase-like deaminating enzyme
MVREAGDAVSAFGETTLTGLRVERGRVRGVETSAGAIDAEHVVIAAGLWGPIVAKMLRGLEIPLVPVQHQLV